MATTATLVGVTSQGLVLEVGGRIKRVSRKYLDRVSVCRTVSMEVAAGDRLQLKANGKGTMGEKLANGEIVAVSAVEVDGRIRLDDGRVIPPTFRQFQRGYAVTSYGSQGKTVDHVLFADAGSRPATNAQQWYVTMSRGRKSIRIFTPDRAALRRSISRSGDRALALDLAETLVQAKRRMGAVLKPMRRGRELARKLCQIAMREWVNKLIFRTRHLNETTSPTV